MAATISQIASQLTQRFGQQLGTIQARVNELARRGEAAIQNAQSQSQQVNGKLAAIQQRFTTDEASIAQIQAFLDTQFPGWRPTP